MVKYACSMETLQQNGGFIFGLIPLYTYLFALLRYQRHKKEVELAQSISITILSFIKSEF